MILSLLLDIGLKFYAVPSLPITDLEILCSKEHTKVFLGPFYSLSADLFLGFIY